MTDYYQRQWKEENFISDLTKVIGNINISNILDKDFLKLSV